MIDKKIKARITARKHEGDHAASWAVFIDGKPYVTGLYQREVGHYKKKAAAHLLEQAHSQKETMIA